MKFFALAALVATVSAAAADASVANGALCTADKECTVATDACCQTFATAAAQTTATVVAADMKCKAGITAKQTATPWMNTCVARVKGDGASSLAATAVAAAAAALYLL